MNFYRLCCLLLAVIGFMSSLSTFGSQGPVYNFNFFNAGSGPALIPASLDKPLSEAMPSKDMKSLDEDVLNQVTSNNQEMVLEKKKQSWFFVSGGYQNFQIKTKREMETSMNGGSGLLKTQYSGVAFGPVLYFSNFFLLVQYAKGKMRAKQDVVECRDSSCSLLQSQDPYFANSQSKDGPSSGWNVALGKEFKWDILKFSTGIHSSMFKTKVTQAIINSGQIAETMNKNIRLHSYEVFAQFGIALSDNVTINTSGRYGGARVIDEAKNNPLLYKTKMKENVIASWGANLQIAL